MMLPVWAFLVANIVIPVSVVGFEGYDCEESEYDSTISLLESSNCNLKKQDDLREEDLNGGIVQRAPWKSIPVQYCSQVFSKRTVYCTWLATTEHKLNAGNVEGFVGASLTADQCAQLHRTNSIVQQGIKVNVSGSGDVSWTNNTQIGSSGYCSKWLGEQDYTLFVLSKDNSSMIVRSDDSGRFASATFKGHPVIIDSSGTSGRTAVGHTLLWESGAIPSCFLETLYKGQLTKVTDSEGSEHAMIKEKGVGFVVGGRVTLCNMKIWSSNVPMTFVFWGDVVDLPDVTQEPTVGVPQHMLALIQGLFTSTTMSQAKSASEIRMTMCSVETQVHRDIIYGVSTDPDMTAYRLIGERGWRLIRAGAAVHLYRCPAKEVQITPSSECTLDIPVKVSGTNYLMYLDPVSFVIHSTANSVACDDSRLPYIQIRTQWYRVGQSVTPVKSPSPVPSVVSGSSLTRLPSSEGLYPQDLVAAAVEKTSIEEAIRFNSQITVARFASGVGVRDPKSRLSEVQPMTPKEHTTLRVLTMGAMILGPLSVGLTLLTAIIKRRRLLKWIAEAVGPSLFALFSSYHSTKSAEGHHENMQALV